MLLYIVTSLGILGGSGPIPRARYTALFFTLPSSRIFTLRASKKTTGYISSNGRFLDIEREGQVRAHLVLTSMQASVIGVPVKQIVVTAADGRKVLAPKGMSEHTAQKIAAKVSANSEARKLISK